MLTIVDIAPGDGRTIDTNILCGSIQLDRIMKLYLTTQGRPKVSDWNVWRKVLMLVVTGEKNQLFNPVGKFVEILEQLYVNK